LSFFEPPLLGPGGFSFGRAALDCSIYGFASMLDPQIIIRSFYFCLITTARFALTLQETLMSFGICFKRAAFGACIVFSMATAGAAEIAGVKLDDTVRLANQELKLNGAGIRYKAIFKVYVAGLYLSGKKSTVADVLALPGPKRMTIVMLRDVGNEEFGNSFMAGIQKNSDKAEKAKVITQLLKFGELFASIPELKKGDMLTADWMPGTGTVILLNGKKIAEAIPDLTFYTMFLKIWLGEKPADAQLKKLLLGEQEEAQRNAY
jgi:hypothetical protein